MQHWILLLYLQKRQEKQLKNGICCFFLFVFKEHEHDITRIGPGAEQEAAQVPSQQQVGQEQEQEVELQLPAVHKHLPGVFPKHCSLQGYVQDHKQTAPGKERKGKGTVYFILSILINRSSTLRGDQRLSKCKETPLLGFQASLDCILIVFSPSTGFSSSSSHIHSFKYVS